MDGNPGTAIMTLTWDSIRARFTPALRLLGLEQPLSLSLWLWPVLWSSAVATAGSPSAASTLRLLAAVLLARVAAGIVVSGQVRGMPGLTAGQGRLFALAAALAALALATFDLAALLIGLAAAALALAWLPLRRRSHLGELLLAPAAAAPSLIAFLAQTGHLGRLAWLLFVLHALWAVLQASTWAVARRDADLKNGFGSTAILFDGALSAAFWALSVLLWLGMLLVGREFTVSGPYYAGLAVGLLALIAHGWLAARPQRLAKALGALSAAGAALTAALLGLGGAV